MPSARDLARRAVPLAIQDRFRTLAEAVVPARRRRAGQWRRKQAYEVALSRQISPSGRVLAGPFAGMWMPFESSSGSMAPLLAGTYEMELNASVEDFIARNPSAVIDIGAAEGYYAVGFALRLPQTDIYAFDIDHRARRLCMEATQRNATTNVAIKGRIDATRLNDMIVDGTLIVCDCEGCELDLLDPVTAPKLLLTDLLVELHDFLNPGLTAVLTERFGRTHNVTLIDWEERDREQPQLAHLPVQAERAVAEGRPTDPHQQWAVMTRRRLS